MRGLGSDGLPKETHPCSVCSKRYSRLEYLRRHERKHTSEKPFGCNLCTKSFARSDVLLRHKRRCHSDEFQESDATAAANALISASHSRRESSATATRRTGKRSERYSDSGDEDTDLPPAQRPRKDSFDNANLMVDPSLRDGFDTSLFAAAAAAGGVYPQSDGISSQIDPSLKCRNANEQDGVLPHLNLINPDQVLPRDLSTLHPDLGGHLPWNMFSSTGMPLADSSLMQQDHHVHETGNGDMNGNGASDPVQPVPQSIEHAAALLSMAYAMHKERVPTPVEAGPSDFALKREDVNGNVIWPPIPFGGDGQVGHTYPTHNHINGSAGRSKLRSTDLNSGNSLILAHTPTGFNSSGVENWEPFLSPRADDSPFDISAYFPAIEAPEWGQTFEEPEGWSHFPACAVSHSTPWAELPLLRVQGMEKMRRGGKEADPTDPFYVPLDRFKGCYEVTHWGLPSVKTLGKIAQQCAYTLLAHVPIVHLPTFNFRHGAPGLTFAMAVVGSPRHSSIAGDGTRRHLSKEMASTLRNLDRQYWAQGHSILAPDGAAPQIELLEDEPNEEEKRFEDTKPIIADAKRVMLRRMFDKISVEQDSGGMLTGTIQALIIFASPFLFSTSGHQRLIGYVEIQLAIPGARKAGLFDFKRPHSALYASLILPDPNVSLNTVWKEWIKLETQRRIAWMLYLFDTLSVIETGSVPVLSPKDMAFMPLPAPDCIWQAATAEAWQQALMAYSPITLDAAMREHFTTQSTAYATPGFVTPSSMSSILLRSDFGMFGRLVMAISLLRGLLLLARSNSEAIDIAEHWGFVPSRFASGKLMVALVKAYGNALYKWRQGWDFDSLCFASAPSPSSTTSGSNQSSTPSFTQSRSNSKGEFEDTPCSQSLRTPTNESSAPPTPGRLMFYEEALPFYWLSQTIHSALVNDPATVYNGALSPGQLGPDRIAHLDMKAMLQSARVFTRMGEGVSTTQPAP